MRGIIEHSKNIFKEYSPRWIYAIVSSIFFICLPHKETRIHIPKNEMWLVKTAENQYYTTDRHNLHRGSASMKNIKNEKYQLEVFVEAESGDVVVDIGAFVGEFALSVSNTVNHVIAFEADPSTYRCLERNTSSINNIDIYNYALSDENKTLDFHSGADPSESSLIDVDEGLSKRITVEARELRNVLPELGIDSVDYLKLDAEGAEPEVLRGCEGIEIKKLAVDVYPERHGESTLPAVQSILENRGYEIKVQEPMIYARQN